MSRVPLAALVLLLGCRPPVALEKQPPFDFDAHPGPTRFSAEADLLSRWNDARADSLRTFWESGEAGSFQGVDGVEVVYRVHRAAQPKADVVLTPGRTEAIIKYAEVASDLVTQGYTVWALTLRGQGEAGRMLPDPDKGYVAFFDDYVADTHQFLSTVVRPGARRVFLLAHSLSGAVAANLVDAHPEDVDALVLSAPMLEIDLGAFPSAVAASLGAGVCDASDGSGWAIGSGPYREETDFASNTVSQSEARWTWKVQQLRDDERIRLGGLTWRWLCQALVGSSRGSQVGRFSATPTLLLQASGDTFVKPAGQRRYCDDAPRCTLSRVEGGRHELLQEKDELRDVTLSRVVRFFDAQVTP